jgi:hypothetical protein
MEDTRLPPQPSHNEGDIKKLMVPATLALGESFAAHLRTIQFHIDAKLVDEILARIREEQ